MKTIIDFLGASPAFHVATTDANNHPRVRPFSFVMEWEGKLTFCTSSEKPVYRQLEANPYVEISSFNHNSGEWMRISGKVKLFQSTAANRNIYEVMPALKELYGDEYNPALVCFHIEEGQAAIYSFTEAEPRIIKL